MAKFPFTVCFAYTRDETNHMADVLLPDCTDLEGLQLLRIGGTKYVEQFWDYQGFALRDPAVPPQGEAKDFTWIATELARRTGCSKPTMRPSTAAPRASSFPARTTTSRSLRKKRTTSRRSGTRLAAPRARRSPTAPNRKGSPGSASTDSASSRFRACSGTSIRNSSQEGLRFEQPYQEQLFRIGKELGRRLHEQGINWWDRQLEEYEPLPQWRDLNALWEDALAKHFTVRIADYPFWLITARSMQYSWGGNVGIQLIKEVADNVAGHGSVVMNDGAAASAWVSPTAIASRCVRRSIATEGTGHAVRGHPSRHAADDRPVRSLGDAVRQGLPRAEHERADADAARSHRRHRVERRSRQGQGHASSEARHDPLGDGSPISSAASAVRPARRPAGTPTPLRRRCSGARCSTSRPAPIRNVSRIFVPVGCQHCADPPCMHVCPSTATRQRADGIVTIDYDICIGCAYCDVACPYQARFKIDAPQFAYDDGGDAE